MAECKHNLRRRIVCVKCGYVLTDKDKNALHRHAFELMEEEEKGGAECTS